MARKRRSNSGKGTGRKSTRRRGTGGSSRSAPLLDREQQRLILAYALLGLALLVLVSLVPLDALPGVGEAEGGRRANAVGAVGEWLRATLVSALGIGAFLVPALIGLGGVVAHRWIGRGRGLRLGILLAGLLVVVPTGLGALGSPHAGFWGAALSSPLTTAIGLLGALLVTAAALVVLSIATLGWNPLASLGRGVAGSGRVLAQAGRGTARAAGRAREAMRIAPRPGEDDLDSDGLEPNRPFEPVLEPEPEPVPAGVSTTATAAAGARAPSEPAVSVAAVEPEPDAPPTRRGPDPLPGLDLLTPADVSDRQGMDEELDRLGLVLVEKLGTFNVECTLAGRTTGPVVTQFEVVPAPGVKVNRIASLDADLALAMKAKSIRIVAPIPGKGAVGVEIPNPKANVVQLREILEARQFGGSKAAIPLALGRDLTGRPYVADLVKMPHVLIAGATGSGKSVCLNTIITSMVYRHTPETLRLLLIDPKMVELSAYVDLPHLRHSVVTDPRDAAGVLKWAVLEMERRYTLMSVNGVRSLAEFNKRVRSGATLRLPDADGPEGDPDRFVYSEGVLPYIVVVVDELADLMMTVQGEVERPLTQLAQKARAIGIHLIVATQRPSVNVITGLIKANFPTRIAFRVASKTDSRTILDQNGADALLGNGDMLFLPPGQSEPVRMQGAFISTDDTDSLMGWFRELRDRPEVSPATEAASEDDILEVVKSMEAEGPADLGLGNGGVDRDEFFRQAAEVCIQHQQGSTSLLQRKLRVGYGRAARIVDQLHETGILGPPEGSKPREVLIGMDGLDLLLSGDSPGTGAETSG